MYVYVCICMYMYVYVYLYVCVYVCMYACMYVWMYACTHADTYVICHVYTTYHCIHTEQNLRALNRVLCTRRVRDGSVRIACRQVSGFVSWGDRPGAPRYPRSN